MPSQTAYLSAWWYACGANDTRDPDFCIVYVPPDDFAAYYVQLFEQQHTPSVREAFKTFSGRGR